MMSLRPILIVLSLGIVLMLQLGASCASSGGSNGDSDRDQNTTYERPNRIPSNSDLVREGTGKLKWTADLDGDIYVYDPAKDHIDYSGPVRRGQEVVAHPSDDKVYVNERVVSSQNLRKDATHQIYFARPRSNSGGSGSNSDRLPSAAKVVTEGKGEITYRTPGAGTLWVADADDSRVIFTRRVKAKSTVVVTPGKDLVTLDGKPVYENNLVRDHEHRIYFDRD